MKTYKNILVGYDDSDYSKAALVEAMHIAKALNSSVTMAHAVFFDSEEFNTSQGQLEERLQLGRDVCLKARDLYSREFGTDIECHVVKGEPHEVIPGQAVESGADLIVMGTHGRKGLRRMLMGSVTSGVILDAKCDVLVVKRSCDECTGTYRSILIPYDGSDHAKKAIERAAEFYKPGVTVTLLYVIPRYEEMVGFIKTESIREEMFAEARKLVNEGEKLAQEKGMKVNTMVEEGHVASRVVDVAEGLKSELVIMGSHGWRGMDKAIIGSTAERVISHANIPVLVMRR